MSSWIPKRSWLVVALLAGQLIVLMAGVAAFGQWLENGLSNTVRKQVLDASQQIAAQFAHTVEMMGIKGIANNPRKLKPEDWSRLQDLVDQTHLPNGGFLCVISNDMGQVIAYPGLREHPAESVQLPFAKTLLSRPVENPNGWTRLPNGTYILAAKPLPGLAAQMLVLQPDEPLRRVIDDFVYRVRMIGFVVTVCLVAFSAVLSLLIIRGYENRMAAVNENLEEVVDHRSRALMRSREGAIFGLAKLAESRDGQTGEHLERICAYVEILARQLTRRHPDLGERWVHALSVAASLHDIGKVGIPDAVLLKPGPLTPDERRLIQKHPLIGGQTLTEIQQRWGDDPFLATASEICSGHHEWWDGSGYPQGLRGVNIPLPARIVALADVYDALTSRRAYKEPMSHEHARQVIIEQSGTHFDPSVVDAFLTAERRFREVSSNGQYVQNTPPMPSLAPPLKLAGSEDHAVL